MKKIKEIAKTLIKLNIKEVNELQKILIEDYGLKIENVNNMVTNKKENIENDNKENKIEEDSLCNIYLNTIGTVKLPVIKLINNITGLSLTESKKKVDNLPSLIKEGITLNEAKKIEEDFKKIDAIIEIKKK
ncbi:MAG: ribosomal protein L7/L12 [Candidatus Shikimatogenerans bostrichidophilus]|nr:MAG: ribosomal protein L7/L12 [Candidatus Shikimatogenerans bostrichidophilus]